MGHYTLTCTWQLHAASPLRSLTYISKHAGTNPIATRLLRHCSGPARCCSQSASRLWRLLPAVALIDLRSLPRKSGLICTHFWKNVIIFVMMTHLWRQVFCSCRSEAVTVTVKAAPHKFSYLHLLSYYSHKTQHMSCTWSVRVCVPYFAVVRRGV